jgi:hypothetical protein
MDFTELLLFSCVIQDVNHSRFGGLNVAQLNLSSWLEDITDDFLAYVGEKYSGIILILERISHIPFRAIQMIKTHISHKLLQFIMKDCNLSENFQLMQLFDGAKQITGLELVRSKCVNDYFFHFLTKQCGEMLKYIYIDLCDITDDTLLYVAKR